MHIRSPPVPAATVKSDPQFIFLVLGKEQTPKECLHTYIPQPHLLITYLVSWLDPLLLFDLWVEGKERVWGISQSRFVS